MPKALRKVTPDDMPACLAAELAEPVLVEMRKLNNRSLKILRAAEESRDYTTNGYDAFSEREYGGISEQTCFVSKR